MFEKLSKRLGIDIDKVVLNKDKNEKYKLERQLKKETFKERTRQIK